MSSFLCSLPSPISFLLCLPFFFHPCFSFSFLYSFTIFISSFIFPSLLPSLSCPLHFFPFLNPSLPLPLSSLPIFSFHFLPLPLFHTAVLFSCYVFLFPLLRFSLFLPFFPSCFLLPHFPLHSHFTSLLASFLFSFLIYSLLLFFEFLLFLFPLLTCPLSYPPSFLVLLYFPSYPLSFFLPFLLWFLFNMAASFFTLNHLSFLRSDCGEEIREEGERERGGRRDVVVFYEAFSLRIT